MPRWRFMGEQWLSPELRSCGQAGCDFRGMGGPGTAPKTPLCLPPRQRRRARHGLHTPVLRSRGGLGYTRCRHSMDGTARLRRKGVATSSRCATAMDFGSWHQKTNLRNRAVRSGAVPPASRLCPMQPMPGTCGHAWSGHRLDAARTRTCVLPDGDEGIPGSKYVADAALSGPHRLASASMYEQYGAPSLF